MSRSDAPSTWYSVTSALDSSSSCMSFNERYLVNALGSAFVIGCGFTMHSAPCWERTSSIRPRSTLPPTIYAACASPSRRTSPVIETRYVGNHTASRVWRGSRLRHSVAGLVSMSRRGWCASRTFFSDTPNACETILLNLESDAIVKSNFGMSSGDLLSKSPIRLIGIPCQTFTTVWRFDVGHDEKRPWVNTTTGDRW